jgi:hypothetical protein
MTDEDRDLRERFARLRHEDRAHVPPFRAPRAQVAPRWRRLGQIAAAAAVVLIAVVLARPDRTPPPILGRQIVDLGTVDWKSPTDFLLLTPGSELMRTVPAVGSPDDWTLIDLRRRSPAPESTRSQRSPS